MALKGDREIYEARVDCFLNEAGTPGSICCFSTYGSGVSLDNTKQLVTIAANPSGQKVAGVLVDSVVDIDTTRQYLNTQKDEVVKGNKVLLVKEGWLVTNKLETCTPTGGEAAYVGHSGLFANAAAIAAYPVGGCAVTEESNATKFPMVGRFVTTKDELGYCKIDILVK